MPGIRRPTPAAGASLPARSGPAAVPVEAPPVEAEAEALPRNSASAINTNISGISQVSLTHNINSDDGFIHDLLGKKEKKKRQG